MKQLKKCQIRIVTFVIFLFQVLILAVLVAVANAKPITVPTYHAPALLAHAPVAVAHAPAVAVSSVTHHVAHAPAVIAHAPTYVSHAPTYVSHAPAVVAHAPVAVAHAPVAHAAVDYHAHPKYAFSYGVEVSFFPLSLTLDHSN